LPSGPGGVPGLVATGGDAGAKDGAVQLQWRQFAGDCGIQPAGRSATGGGKGAGGLEISDAGRLLGAGQANQIVAAAFQLGQAVGQVALKGD